MPKDKTASDVSKMIKDSDVKLIDFKFTDLLGTWQHFTTTLTEYNEEIFTDGLGFDGSSIRGWRAINASDMLVIPDPATAWIDIFNAEPTLSLICTIVDPITREPYDRDRRLEEALFLGLRVVDGVDLAALRARYEADPAARFAAAWERAAAAGIISWRGSQVRLTPAGRVRSNELFAELIADPA